MCEKDILFGILVKVSRNLLVEHLIPFVDIRNLIFRLIALLLFLLVHTGNKRFQQLAHISIPPS